ncbi:MAG TPA: PGPGW domain-containing protein [Planctomycetaceae bacterium]|nr:PGPGW domain-containing protein [Planctomycetaceae bacterium]
MAEWFDQFREWYRQFQLWFADHGAIVWWLTAVSAVMFVGTLLAIPWIVARIPSDYFRGDRERGMWWFDRHPALRITALVVKNAIGAVLVLGGIAMLVLPGQGVLSILIGLSLLNFPGKRRLEIWLIRRPSVMRGINWLRRRKGKPPLEPPEDLK